MKTILLLLLFSLVNFGCDREPPKTINPVVHRDIGLIKKLVQNGKQPTPVLDLYFVEHSIGIPSKAPGPTDYVSFLRIEVESEHIKKWTKYLEPPGRVFYAAPRTSQSWWLTESQFENCTFYKPGTLFNRIHGWVCITDSAKSIYVYTFTT